MKEEKHATSAQRKTIRLTKAAKQLIELYRFKNTGIDKKSYLLFYEKLNISYTHIPKNASTTLKRTLTAADGTYCPESRNDIHNQDNLFSNYPLSAHVQAKKIIAFRNPFRRLVSAYLNKMFKQPAPRPNFVRMMTAIFKDLRELTDEKAAEAILAGARPTFSELIRYLSCKSDEEIDHHFRSQLSFCTFTEYDEIFLVDDLTDLWKKSSLSHIHLIYHDNATSHKAVKNFMNYETTRQIPNIQLGSLLPAGCNSTILPHYSLFFQDDETNKLFRTRYADDIFLYNSILPGAAGV